MRDTVPNKFLGGAFASFMLATGISYTDLEIKLRLIGMSLSVLTGLCLLIVAGFKVVSAYRSWRKGE